MLSLPVLRGHKPETQIGAGPRLSESFGICCAAQGELRHGGWVGGWVGGCGPADPPPRKQCVGSLVRMWVGGWVGGWVLGGVIF